MTFKIELVHLLLGTETLKIQNGHVGTATISGSEKTSYDPILGQT